MAIRTKPAITGSTGTLLCCLWGAYSNYNTAADLPADAGRIAKMIADPPVWLPWLVAAGFIVLLAWALWSRETKKEEPLEHSDVVYTQNHSGSGNNSMDFGE